MVFLLVLLYNSLICDIFLCVDFFLEFRFTPFVFHSFHFIIWVATHP